MRYRTKDGDLLDQVCWDYYGDHPGAVEQVLVANPGLADSGPALPAGLLIELPELKPATRTAAQSISLWD